MAAAVSLLAIPAGTWTSADASAGYFGSAQYGIHGSLAPRWTVLHQGPQSDGSFQVMLKDSEQVAVAVVVATAPQTSYAGVADWIERIGSGG